MQAGPSNWTCRREGQAKANIEALAEIDPGPEMAIKDRCSNWQTFWENSERLEFSDRLYAHWNAEMPSETAQFSALRGRLLHA